MKNRWVLRRSAILTFWLTLIVWLGSMYKVMGQGEEHVIGYRLNHNEKAVVFGDWNHQPNFEEVYTLTPSVYITIFDDDTFVCPEEKKSLCGGKTYRKILIPGDSTGAGNQLKMATINQDEIKISGITGLEKPINISNRQIQKSEWGRVFWIEEKYVPGGNAGEKFKPQKIKSKWVAGVLAVPFKYRWSYKSSASIFTSESTLGASIQYKFWRSSVFENSAGVVAAAGLTLINPNYAFADEDEEQQPLMAGATACIGINMNVGKTQLGVIYGHDFAGSDWEFHKQPWLAFAIGFNFWSNAKNADQSQ